MAPEAWASATWKIECTEMFDILRDFSHWISSFADSDWAVVALGLNSFTESIFNPIPPDPLLIAASIFRPHLALWLAALTTLSSVAGGLVGHWLGQRFGRPLLNRLIDDKKVDAAEGLFKKYGAWAILIAAFTPIPYKVFAILAGVLKMNRRVFLLASLVGRGMRFFLLGSLIFVFGESIEAFIDANFELLTVTSAVAFIVILGVAAVIARQRRRANSTAT